MRPPTYAPLAPLLIAVCCFALVADNLLADDDAHPVWNDEPKSLALILKTIDESESPAVQAALLKGILDGLSGRRQVRPPDGWNSLRNKLLTSADDKVQSRANALAQLFGDIKAQELSMALAANAEIDPQKRTAALRSLVSQKAPGVEGLLASLLDEEAMRLTAIRSIADVESPDTADTLLKRFSDYSPECQKAVIETLASRASYASILLSALKRGSVEKDQIPSHVARSLKMTLGPPFEKVFGEVRSLEGDRVQRMAHYKKLLSPERLAKADAGKGRVVYDATCASCHTLYGVGGKVGPDLTGSNRANLDYILLNSVDPSYDVPEGYRMVIIQTAEGRVVNGVVAREDNQRLVLKTPQQPEVVILKDDIETRKVSDKSMMPDGQLDQLKPQQVADLIKYLQTTEQVAKP